MNRGRRELGDAPNAAAAEFERSVIVERINAGLAAARERAVRLGRPPTMSRHIAANENKRVFRSTKTSDRKPAWPGLR